VTTETVPPTTVPAPGDAAPGRARSALAGLLAAAAALGAGELTAGLISTFRSPVEAVAEAIIANVPESVKAFAIATFGENDKIALVVGTIVIVAVFGTLVGVAARKRRIVGIIGIGLFGVLGALASLLGAFGGPLAAVPSLVSGVVGVVALLALLDAARPAVRTHDTGGDTRHDTGRAGASRRSFLVMTGIVAAGAALSTAGGRLLAGRFSAATSRDAAVLPPAADPAPPLPAGVEVGVDGVAPFTTPFDEFYRVDVALSVPQVRAEDWSLRIHGMVDNEITLSYADMQARNLIERDITLACVSNTVGGNLIGHARWTGVLLSELLDEAGVQAGADQIVGRSVDAYTCGFPLESAYDRDALVVIGMNGEPLPIERGFPARLITPGLYGYVSATKWLSEIEITTFDAFDQYWVPRGWDEQAPIKMQTRVDTPRGQSVPAGPTPIAGVAWAQTRGIAKVEVRIDGGDWTEAVLAEQANVDSWRQWRFDWDATPGAHRITVRSTDENGEVQTEDRTDPFPNGASGWMTQFVTVTEA
jgi:DMSO/TMAO reductase YedYZ molybdopterin-dependent catalytic subunit